MNHGEGTGGLEVVDESLGWGLGVGRDGKRGCISGDLDPSDRAAVASATALTCGMTAQICPSSFLISSFFSFFFFLQLVVLHHHDS